MLSLRVEIATQRLHLLEGERVVVSYPVSTAKKGVGEVQGSEMTPRGVHSVRAKIGTGMPLHSVFVGRRPTGEIYSPDLAAAFPARDWILTRILWLSGCERGKNRLGNVDTMRRFIYIHGTHEEHLLGQPQSHGCIRMANTDILALFDAVPAGTKLLIE